MSRKNLKICLEAAFRLASTFFSHSIAAKGHVKNGWIVLGDFKELAGGPVESAIAFCFSDLLPKARPLPLLGAKPVSFHN